MKTEAENKVMLPQAKETLGMPQPRRVEKAKTLFSPGSLQEAQSTRSQTCSLHICEKIKPGWFKLLFEVICYTSHRKLLHMLS